MSKEIISKFNFVTNIILLFTILTIGFVWADTNGIWVYAEDIVAGTFGADEGGGDFIFPNNLNVSQNMVVGDNLCVGDECHSSWASVCQSWLETNSIT